MSKIASGYGILYWARFEYSPVPLLLKSGIPDPVLIPAPWTTTIFWKFEPFKPRTKSGIVVYDWCRWTDKDLLLVCLTDALFELNPKLAKLDVSVEKTDSDDVLTGTELWFTVSWELLLLDAFRIPALTVFCVRADENPFRGAIGGKLLSDFWLVNERAETDDCDERLLLLFCRTLSRVKFPTLVVGMFCCPLDVAGDNEEYLLSKLRKYNFGLSDLVS